MEEKKAKTSRVSSCFYTFLKIYFAIAIVGFCIMVPQLYYKIQQDYEKSREEYASNLRREKYLFERYGNCIATKLYVINGDSKTATIEIIGEDHIGFSASALPYNSGKTGKISSSSVEVLPEDDMILSIFSRERSGNVYLKVTIGNSVNQYLCPKGGTHLFKLTHKPRIEWKTVKYSRSGVPLFPDIVLQGVQIKKLSRPPGIYKMSDKDERVYAFDETPPKKIKTYSDFCGLPIPVGIKIKKFQR
ncbi:MAG: hypothetical protein Kow0029_15550 [Candidatus Rifleibacteriota bacterium]